MRGLELYERSGREGFPFCTAAGVSVVGAAQWKLLARTARPQVIAAFLEALEKREESRSQSPRRQPPYVVQHVELSTSVDNLPFYGDAGTRRPLTGPEINAAIRLRQAELRQREVESKRREPSAEQWRAVRVALEKFLGLGRFAAFGAVCVNLPEFTIEWDTGETLSRTGSAAVTRFFDDGSIVVVLRTDQTPEQIERAMCHELQHVSDSGLIYGHQLTAAQYEARAEATEERLSRL